MTRLVLALVVSCWAVVAMVSPYLAKERAIFTDELSSLSPMSERRNLEDVDIVFNHGKDDISGGSNARNDSSRPRILTVLTTYDERSGFVKPYKEALLNRSGDYRPQVRLLQRRVLYLAWSSCNNVRHWIKPFDLNIYILSGYPFR